MNSTCERLAPRVDGFGSRSEQPTSRWLWTLVILWALGNGSVCAAEVAPNAPPNPEKQAQKERVAEAAGWLLVLVAIIGAVLLILVVLWSARVRRLARRQLPPQTPPDKLWYLRRKPPL